MDGDESARPPVSTFGDSSASGRGDGLTVVANRVSAQGSSHHPLVLLCLHPAQGATAPLLAITGQGLLFLLCLLPVLPQSVNQMFNLGPVLRLCGPPDPRRLAPPRRATASLETGWSRYPHECTEGATQHSSTTKQQTECPQSSVK